MSVAQAGQPKSPTSYGVGSFSEIPKLIESKVYTEHLCKPDVSNSRLAVEALPPVGYLKY